MNPLIDIVTQQKKGIANGICSICSANEFVIMAAMEKAMESGVYVLIESTANQVNQFGGYTGMTPNDFKEFVFSIAKKVGFEQKKIILGGDHLGPLTWKDLSGSEAMENAEELVRQYITAGFTKIHLDTSMHLGDDDINCVLSKQTIAKRGAVLCKVCEETWAQNVKKDDECRPVYIIGSEVPVPGGTTESEGVTITTVNDFEDTISAYTTAFTNMSISTVIDRIVGIVVQPGVEFGDDSIHEYDKEAAHDLTKALKKHQKLVFEGHSTDYQTKFKLKQMIEDGIAILKVGPALTFELRQALFMLSYIEKELLKDNTSLKCSDFIEVLTKEMDNDPKNWIKYYHGTPEQIDLAKKFSFSDRCRYYLPYPNVDNSIELMISNLGIVKIPLTLISQFLPEQYRKIREGNLRNEPIELIKDKIKGLIDDYSYAVSQ